MSALQWFQLAASLIFLLSNVQLGFTVNSTAFEDTKPLYLLVLLPDYTEMDIFVLGTYIAREEINNRSDILPGYHIELIDERIEICSSSDAGIGLSVLVKYTVSPSCRPVVAVMGLECSSHTAKLSSVAGHKGFDLIQLSRTSSPIFETRNYRFPHLWRFSTAATVYSDTILAIMDQFNWTRVGIIYSVESSLYSKLAIDLEQKIKQSGNKSVAFNLGVGGTKAYYLDNVISNIKATETSILVNLLLIRQTGALLSRASHHGMSYPYYTWIHVKRPIWLKSAYGKAGTIKTTLGHISVFLQSTESKDTYLFSNQTFSQYSAKFRALYEKKVQPLLNISSKFIPIEANFYDQVWAIALAVNNSLQELKNRNLSIDNYTIGQPEVTAVIEEQLKKLKFQGGSGWIEFNHYRAVSTPINVYWILGNNKGHRQVGMYDPLHPLDFRVNLSSSDLPSDTLPRVYEYILIPLPAAIVLYILTGGVIVFTTIQLILYLCYRRHKVIKATSPFLSLLMFVGCYLFCAAAIQLNTLGSFVLSPETFTAMAITEFVFVINGISLIFITLFVKLLRVYRIFTCWNQDVGRQWSNLSLLLAILSLSVIPNIGLGILFGLKLPTHSTYCYKFFEGSLPLIEIHTRIEPTSNYAFIGMASLYTIVFLTFALYLGVRSRKIKMKNFNSSGQVYLLLAVLVIAICLAASVVIIFLVREQESIANAVMVTLFLIFVTACQLILFLPKILTAMFDGKFSQEKSSTEKLLSSISKIVFS